MFIFLRYSSEQKTKDNSPKENPRELTLSLTHFIANSSSVENETFSL